MVNNSQMILLAAGVLLAACVGKGVACWAAARFNGEDNRTALAIGSLMNARGLMELIILNIVCRRESSSPLYFPSWFSWRWQPL